MLPCVPALSMIAALAFASSVHAQILGVTYAGDAVSVAPGTGTVEFIGPTGVTLLNAAAQDSTGRIVAANKAGAQSPRIIEIDPETGIGSFLTFSLINDIRALAFDPDDDNRLLAVESVGSIRKNLWVLDLTKFAGEPGFKTLLGQLDLTGMAGLTFAPDGVLFGWSTSWGLVTIDLGIDGNGPPDVIDVNAEQDGTSDIQSIAYSPATGTLYGMNKGLFVIDPSTGAYEQVAHNDDFDVRGVEFVNPCPADVDMNGRLDIVDFVSLQNAFDDGSPIADCDENGTLDILDFICFQQLFAAGCS